MTRHNHKEPDDRLDWRDPDMPCIRVADNVFTGEITVELVPPEDVTAEARDDLKRAKTSLPSYHLDPSYSWAQQASFNKLEAKALKLGDEALLDCLVDFCTSPGVCIYTGCKRPDKQCE
jgi:hypothetical protein